MVRLYLSITELQMEELKKHLLYNGYHVDFEADDVIAVDEEEVAYVKTILRDREVEFSEEGGLMAYMVYVDYQEDRILPEEIEHFKELDDALQRANELKDDFYNSDEWELGDEFDAGELTDSENDVLFIHKKTGMEAYVSIHSFELK